MRVRRLLLGVVAAAAVPLAVPTPAYAADNDCAVVDPTTPATHTQRPSAPYTLLGVEAAQRAAGPPAEPVRVAVLSSGVAGGLPVRTAVDRSGVGGEVVDPQGTIVAGIVAGPARPDGSPVGFAPEAELVDVRVFVDRSSDETREQPSTPSLVSGLTWVAQEAGRERIEVAVVPFVVAESPQLKAAVRRVREAGVVLVAASGDRPAEGAPFAAEFDDPPARDEDGGPLFFPAGYDGVVAVNATGTGDPAGALASVVPNSRTTVAAPTYDAVSYGLNGATCLVRPTSTAVAAAEVAGVVALVRQRYPDDTVAQVVARLVDSADGTPDGPTPMTGAGVVQPAEALTRLLAPAPDGQVERTVAQADDAGPAAAPEDPVDLLADARHDAVWWGLIGGGVLVVALLLRPVLARRSR